MKNFIKSSVLLACLSVPGISVAQSNLSHYGRLNELLREIHSHYKARNFLQIDKVRPAFLKEYENFSSLLEKGDVKLQNKIQKNDFKLAENYYSSLTTYYELLQKKYGYSPKVEIAPNEEFMISEEHLSSEITTPSERDMSVINLLMSISPKTPEINYSISNELIEQTKQTPIEYVDLAEDMQDPELEEYLKHEIPEMIDEKKWDKAFGEFYSAQAGLPVKEELSENELPPPIPAEVLTPPPIQDEAVMAAPETQEQENYLVKSEFDKQVANIRKTRVQAVYKEESKIIDEGLKKAQILKENQARFEIKVMDENKNLNKRPESKTTTKERPPVFTHDRLSEDDEDVIIIKFPRNNE